MNPDGPAAPRIAMLAAGEIFGGAERQILLLLEFLRDQAVFCQLYVFEDRELARRSRLLGIPTHVLRGRSGFDIRMARELAARLAQARVDVVHIHSYKPAAMALVARRTHAFTAVKTEHGGSELQGAPTHVQLKLRAYRWIENFSIRRLHAAVVYVTDDLRLQSQREHAMLEVSVIENGIDTNGVKAGARPAELRADRFNLVIAGRLERVKGIDWAIRAMSLQQMPPTAHLHIVGDGPLRESLEQLVADDGVADRVSFYGFRTDAMTFIAHADAVLMPSLHEGLPYTLLESMAAGVPVLASAVGGLKENLRDRETALLFPPQDMQAIARSVAAVYADPTLRRGLASNAREWLLTRFSSQAMGAAYLRVYCRQSDRLAGRGP